MIGRVMGRAAWPLLLYTAARRYLSRPLDGVPPKNEPEAEPRARPGSLGHLAAMKRGDVPERAVPERAFAPHCDASVLHAPGTCEHCDLYPDWQHYRQVARISFTGDDPGDMAPCPSDWFRPASSRDAWPGNRPRY